MTATPTPGDLSARHVEVLTALDRIGRYAAAAGNDCLADDVREVSAAIAALSALPAAGGHRHVASEDDGDTCAVCGRNFRAHATTPQPSAAEDYESWAKQERQREDTATRLGAAAVGAQGDECFCDARGIGAPGVSCGDCPRDYAAPAAGKGVDDVLADMRRTTPGDDEHIEALLADYADKIEAALTRQPVAGGGDADFELWQDGEFVAGSSGPRAEAWREILHYAAQYEQDGAVTIMEVIRRPLAAPAATPTDGGEG